MKHKEPQRKRHHSNRHLSERYIYSGIHETSVGIRLIQYNKQELHAREVGTSESFSKIADSRYINWFQVSGLADADIITRIVKDAGMHNLDAKDILTPQHVVKIEEYNHRLLIVLNSNYYDANNQLQSEHISMLVTGNTVITFTESSNPVFDYAEKALETDLLSVRSRGSCMLLAFLLNTIIANLVESIVRVEELLEDIEEILLDITKDQSNIGKLIQERRRDYMIVRKNTQPLKDQFAKLLHTESEFVTPDMFPVFNDLSDQLLFISQTTEGCREIISSLVDLYISNNDLRMNAIMKRLTIVSTIFIPLTFLVGVWGMNFRFMPELDWRYGYGLAWLLMVVVGVITWWFLKKKDWY